ncbi:peroxiredoxin [Deltaproteobacteria bacterium Smac51]|nr:peroxiredoxin [Deltaproteobacteria bacterium Smac51]
MSITGFTLKDQNDNEVSFAALKGQKYLLSFHPLAWTPVCSRQMQDLDNLYNKFIEKGILPFGVSIDHLYSKKAWAESLGLTKLQLLADFWPHGALAEALGCFIPKAGMSGRSNFLIGGDGEVIWSKRHEIHEQPDFNQILTELP